jgi:ABC-type nitrate/sulfonate/bicarbonate transport system substrate-binding protein
MKRYTWGAVAVGAAVALVTSACSSSHGSNPSGKSGGGSSSMKIAIPANSAAASFIQLAVAAGLTKKHGVDVTLNTSITPPNTPAALVSGSIQGSALTSTATQANGKGLPVINVVNTGTHAPFVMLGGPDIKSVNDLDGKKVVTSAPTDTPGTETVRILKDAGVDAQIVSVASVPGRSALFVSGQADAVYEALNLALKDQAKRPGSTIIGDNTKLAVTPADGIAVTKTYLASHRDAVDGLVKACIEAANMMKNQPAQATPYLEKIYDLSASEVAQFLDRQKASLVTNGVPTEEAYANQAELFNAQPKQSVDWTAGKVQASWDTSLAVAAAKTLGFS